MDWKGVVECKLSSSRNGLTTHSQRSGGRGLYTYTLLHYRYYAFAALVSPPGAVGSGRFRMN